MMDDDDVDDDDDYDDYDIDDDNDKNDQDDINNNDEDDQDDINKIMRMMMMTPGPMFLLCLGELHRAKLKSLNQIPKLIIFKKNS